MTRGAQIEEWKTEQIRKYLEEQFSGRRIDHFPRGDSTAVLFLVMERKRSIHQVLITKKFLDRFTDHAALLDTLSAIGVTDSMRRAGQRTVELH